MIAIYMTGLATIVLLLVPFIPGLRDIPRLIPIHRLIWRTCTARRHKPAQKPPRSPPRAQARPGRDGSTGPFLVLSVFLAAAPEPVPTAHGRTAMPAGGQPTVRGFVAAGLGVSIVPAPSAGSPESATGPVLYPKILDTGAVREICLRWSAERRLLPAAELFRQHVITRAAAGRVPILSK